MHVIILICSVVIVSNRKADSSLKSAMSGQSHLHSADSLTFDILQMQTRMGDRAFSVAGPCARTQFRLTFVMHPAWTLLRSISNRICFLLLTICNNFFILVTVYCCVFYVLLLFVRCWPRLGVSTFCID